MLTACLQGSLIALVDDRDLARLIASHKSMRKLLRSAAPALVPTSGKEMLDGKGALVSTSGKEMVDSEGALVSTSDKEMVDSKSMIHRPASLFKTVEGFKHYTESFLWRKTLRQMRRGQTDDEGNDVSDYNVVSDAGWVFIFT